MVILILCLNICEPEPNPDFDGNRVHGLKFKTKSVATDISDQNKENLTKVETYKLENCYPNPFNISTQIRFSLTHQDFVNLSIYNSIGEKINTILDNDLAGGIYNLAWNGTDDDGNTVTTGVYFVRLQVGLGVVVNKIMCLK